jgi:phosphoribosylglycinamide formyltransferase-1
VSRDERRPTARVLPLAVLLSGTGRTLANLLLCIREGRLSASVVAAASDRDGVLGLDIARDAGVATRAFPGGEHPSRAERDRAMLQWARTCGAQVIVLCGYLSLLDLTAVGDLSVLNIHPALLPAHGGKGCYGDRVHAAVLASGDRVSGATVHLVDRRYDHGPILAQVQVPVLPGDSTRTLADRVFVAECELYPTVLQWLAKGELQVRDGQPLREGKPWQPVMLAPPARLP